MIFCVLCTWKNRYASLSNVCLRRWLAVSCLRAKEALYHVAVCSLVPLISTIQLSLPHCPLEDERNTWLAAVNTSICRHLCHRNAFLCTFSLVTLKRLSFRLFILHWCKRSISEKLTACALISPAPTSICPSAFFHILFFWVSVCSHHSVSLFFFHCQIYPSLEAFVLCLKPSKRQSQARVFLQRCDGLGGLVMHGAKFVTTLSTVSSWSSPFMTRGTNILMGPETRISCLESCCLDRMCKNGTTNWQRKKTAFTLFCQTLERWLWGSIDQWHKIVDSDAKVSLSSREFLLHIFGC